MGVLFFQADYEIGKLMLAERGIKMFQIEPWCTDMWVQVGSVLIEERW